MTSPPPVIVRMPEGKPVSAVFDSPHSGCHYPDDFGSVLDLETLRKGEDAFVDKIFDAVPAHGAQLITATFPRVYIDPNRSEAEIDPGMLDAPWPAKIETTERTDKGKGLLFRRIAGRFNVYDRLLSVEEVRHRIDTCWRPYHDAVDRALNSVHRRFGRVFHVNCHSMPPKSSRWDGQEPEVFADFVLGDRDGTSCAPEFTAFVRGVLESMGYDVAINDPMKGVELVRRYSDPIAGRHSLQIEINRRLYLDRKAIQPNGGYDELKSNIDRLVMKICAFAAGD